MLAAKRFSRSQFAETILSRFFVGPQTFSQRDVLKVSFAILVGSLTGCTVSSPPLAETLPSELERINREANSTAPAAPRLDTQSPEFREVEFIFNQIRGSETPQRLMRELQEQNQPGSGNFWSIDRLGEFDAPNRFSLVIDITQLVDCEVEASKATNLYVTFVAFPRIVEGFGIDRDTAGVLERIIFSPEVNTWLADGTQEVSVETHIEEVLAASPLPTEVAPAFSCAVSTTEASATTTTLAR